MQVSFMVSSSGADQLNLSCWVVSCASRHISDGSQWRLTLSTACIPASCETLCIRTTPHSQPNVSNNKVLRTFCITLMNGVDCRMKTNWTNSTANTVNQYASTRKVHFQKTLSMTLTSECTTLKMSSVRQVLLKYVHALRR